MKKILSLTLAVMLLVSAIPTAFAAEAGGNWAGGTQVEATGSRSTVEDDGSVTHDVEYTITVPAKLAPAGSGTVTLEGMWPSDATVKVTADPSVEMVNSINSADKKTLAVTFTPIELAGNNTVAVSDDETVSVADISAALFGTWSGKFNYNVEYNGEAGGSGTVTPTPDPEQPGDGGDVDGTIGILYGVPYINDEGYYYIFNEDGTGRAKLESFGESEMGFGADWKEANDNLANRILNYPVSATFSEDWTSFTTEGGVVYTAQTANLITFTIDGTEYQAEEGMTWTEWVESDYNTIEAYIEGSFAKATVNETVRKIYGYKDDGGLINATPDEIISDNGNYTWY